MTFRLKADIRIRDLKYTNEKNSIYRVVRKDIRSTCQGVMILLKINDTEK